MTGQFFPAFCLPKVMKICFSNSYAEEDKRKEVFLFRKDVEPILIKFKAFLLIFWPRYHFKSERSYISMKLKRQIEIHNIILIIKKTMSKSPIKDYSRLMGQSRTVKKEEHIPPYRFYRFESSESIVDEIKVKLDLSLKHNAKLLDENSVLSELVTQLRHEVRDLKERSDQMSSLDAAREIKIQAQRQKLLDELEIKQNNHEAEISRLLNEISGLHSQKNDLEIQKNKHLQIFKLDHERKMTNYIQNMKSNQENSKDLYETQIKKLKSVLENLEHDLETTKTQKKLESIRLNGAIKSLEGEINHLKHLNNLELQELKNTFESELHQERRALEREREVEQSNYSVLIKRLKNEVIDKNQEIDALHRKISNGEELQSSEIESLKREKEILLSDLATAEIHHANKLVQEKTKLKEINEEELKNVLNMNQTYIDELKSEVNNLRNLVDCKSSEIRRIYEENSLLKKTLGEEIKSLTNANQELRERMKSMERDHLEEFEAFKIKVSQLTDANVKGLTSYYQNEISVLLTNVNDLEKINKENKDRLYEALQNNDEIRKTFEIEISKQKARVQDLKIKLAANNLEHKEHVTSLGTKMDLTSQTLVREADQKNKSQAFFETEKKKFHSLQNAKDKEIGDLMETMHKMKKLHESELTTLRNEKKEMRDFAEAAENKKNELKKYYEEEMQRKEEKYRAEHSKEADDKAAREHQELLEKNEQVENENIKLQKQVEHLIRENRSMAQQLGLKKGFIETLQLESCAAIEDEKSKIKVMMGNSEMSLKEYYEEKINSRQKDIEHLRNVLSSKQQDIRDLIVKYNGLEKRLEMLLQSQQKVKDFEEKVKNLGLDNNLVKNMAQLFNRK